MVEMSMGSSVTLPMMAKGGKRENLIIPYLGRGAVSLNRKAEISC